MVLHMRCYTDSCQAAAQLFVKVVCDTWTAAKYEAALVRSRESAQLYRTTPFCLLRHVTCTEQRVFPNSLCTVKQLMHVPCEHCRWQLDFDIRK